MSILVVGSMAYDTIETPHGKAESAIGGSVSYFALAARFFSPVSIVAAIGTDFRDEDVRIFAERAIDIRGVTRRDGPTFRWHGRYHEDMNIRDTVSVALNVFADFSPDLLPDQRRCRLCIPGEYRAGVAGPCAVAGRKSQSGRRRYDEPLDQ